MSNLAAPSANVNAANEEKIKRVPRIEYSDVEENVVEPTNKLKIPKKGETGTTRPKRNHGNTSQSAVAMSTRKDSNQVPPKTRTTQKDVGSNDPTPQGQDSSGSSTVMSRYTHVVLSVLVNIVCLCLVCWFLVPHLVRSETSVTTVITLPPEPTSCSPTYDPRIDKLVEQVEHFTIKQADISDSFDDLKAEVTNIQIKENVFESSLAIREDKVKEETVSRQILEDTLSDMNRRIDKLIARSDDLQDETRRLKRVTEALNVTELSLKQQVDDIGDTLTSFDIPRLKSNVNNLTEKAEIQESHKNNVIRMLTHTGVGPLHIAVAFLYIWVLYTTTTRQHHHVVQNADRTEKKHVSRHEPSILERVAVPGRLDNTVCILGFYKSTLELRTRLTQSVLEAGIKQTHFLLDSHEDILRLPPCRLFLVFVDINERHVILEDPSLGMGDLRVTTVRAIEKMGASMVVIYYGDRESRNVGEHLFNRRLTSVHHQSELSALCNRDRFFSTANKFTDRQIHALKNAVAAEMN